MIADAEKPRLLVIEDNRALVETYRLVLGHDFAVTAVNSCRDLRTLTDAGALAGHAVAIADLELGDESLATLADGDPLLAALRTLPTIAVSVLDDFSVLERCLRSWAVDYLTKPFNNNELRLKCLRHARRLYPDFDAARMQALWCEQRSTPLTAIEARLFNHLRTRFGHTVTRGTLAAEVWEIRRDGGRIDATMTRLRPKLEAIGLLLRSAGPGAVVLEPAGF